MLTLLLAFLTSCAFALPCELLDTSQIAARMAEGSYGEKLTAFLPVIGEKTYPACILLFPLFYLVYRVLIGKIQNKQFSLSALLTACLFTLYLLVGECAAPYKKISVLFLNHPQCLITAIKTFGWLTYFYTSIRACFVFFDTYKDGTARGKLYLFIFEKHAYILPFLLILCCWLPYIIAFYPGVVPSDGLKQLNIFFGSGNFSDNHPAFSTMMMGWAMMIGRKLGSDNLGLFLFTGPQMIINAAVIAACFPLFKEMSSPAWLRKLTLLSFALIPIWPNYAYSLLKDSYYMAMILLFVLFLIRILRNTNGFCSHIPSLLLLTASLCLMMLVRHEGQFVGTLVFLSLFTIPSPRQQWKRLLPILLIPLCVINVFNRIIRPQLGIADSPAREALTMPFRQTSAIVTEMEKTLTEEELCVLNELFVYNQIPAMYEGSFENADALKGQFDPWASKDAIKRYLKVWFQLGLKHPLTYINVFLCSNTRYYDPFLGPHRDIYGWFRIEQQTYVNKGLFDLHYHQKTAGIRSAVINIADALPHLPLTSLFYSLGAAVWVMIICLSCLFRRKVRGVIIPLLPGLITYIMIQNSAVNGFFRYLLPLLITLPACIAWTIACVQNQWTAENTKK